jgi:hypothetical protein
VLYDAKTGTVLRRWGDSGKASRMGEQLAFSLDGRLLATTDEYTTHLWEVATGKEVRYFRGHRGEIRSLAFSANGRLLATGSADSTVLLWNLDSPLEPRPGVDEKEADLWNALADADAARAYGALWRLAHDPGKAVPFLRRHLKPATAAEVEEMRRGNADLNSSTYSVRAEASRRLSGLGLAAEPGLIEALEKNPSLEMRRRIERLLKDMRAHPAAGESLRLGRALAVLEYAGTDAARRLLRELAGGAPEAWFTREARAAVRRLDSYMPE